VSRDPQFVAKVNDVVGLYLNPPENAVVLSVDEKTSIQALQRTQLPLPLRSGRARLGTALERLGERESGTTHLEEAVAVYRRENSRTRAPRLGDNPARPGRRTREPRETDKGASSLETDSGTHEATLRGLDI
jgi:hypothetical protein